MTTKQKKTGMPNVWRTAREVPPIAMGDRLGGLNVSGMATATRAATKAASTASSKNTTRHERNWTSTPPTAGAMTGASPHAAPSTPDTEVSLAPRKQSAATA